jgi:YVTN family beta-propeller protein
MKKTFRPGLRLTLAAVCLAAAAGQVSAQTVEDSIQVPGAWVGSLAYNSREDELYGVSETGWFFVISCASNRVTAWYPLTGAFVVAYDSLDDKVYVTYHGTDVESLAVFDGPTHQVVKMLEMPGSTIPVWDPVSNRVYVSCQFSAQVAVVDCATDSLLMYIRVGACPLKMYLNTLRHKLYVLNYDAATVSVIDLATNQVIKTVATGGISDAGYYSAKQDKLYVSGAWDVAVIDGASDTIMTRVPVNVNALGYAEAESHDLLMVGGGGVGSQTDTVFAVDAGQDTVVSRLAVGGEPWSLTWSAATDLVYCANYSGGISVISGDGSRVVTTLTASSAPFVLSLVPRHRRIYVGHLNSRWVYVLKDSLLGVEEPKVSKGLRVRPVEARPNPFSRTTSLCWFEPGMSAVRVYGADGRLVRELPLVESRDGSRHADWDGRDAAGREAPPGVYCVRSASEPLVIARLVKVR